MDSPLDPTPTLQMAGGQIVEMDGRRRDDFDLIDRLLRLYEALRPHRSTYEELLAWSNDLEAEHGARATAQLIRQAAEACRAAGLLRE